LQGMMDPDNRPRIVAGMDNTAEHRHDRGSISRFREVLPQVRNCAREQPSVLLLGLLRSREKVRQYTHTYNITMSNRVHTNTTTESCKFVYNFFPTACFGR
jgi:Tfp pilus assembly pilus retraction ATPase PilT